MNTAPLILIALTTLATAAVAMAGRNLIHSALLLVASWAGIAAFYLWAAAEFVAFAQILIYVGGVSMVVLFAVLLTRNSRAELAISTDSFSRAIAALLAGGAVFGILVGAILRTPLTGSTRSPAAFNVRTLGLELMGTHAAALLIIGIILTVALLGAVVLAAPEPPEDAP